MRENENSQRARGGGERERMRQSIVRASGERERALDPRALVLSALRALHGTADAALVLWRRRKWCVTVRVLWLWVLGTAVHTVVFFFFSGAPGSCLY